MLGISGRFWTFQGDVIYLESKDSQVLGELQSDCGAFQGVLLKGFTGFQVTGSISEVVQGVSECLKAFRLPNELQGVSRSFKRYKACEGVSDEFPGVLSGVHGCIRGISNGVQKELLS